MKKRVEKGQSTLVFALGLVVLMWLLIGLMDDLGRLALAEIRAQDGEISLVFKSAGKGIVATEWFNANLRAGPGQSYAVIANAPSGASLQIVARAGDWLYVKASKSYGWVLADLVALNGKLEFEDIPVWAVETDEECAGDETEASESIAFDAGWEMAGASFDAETGRATHTIALNAVGGSGEYRYFADGEELPDSIFDMTTHLCATQIVMARVEDSEGHEKTLPIYFQTYCPKAWE